MYVFIFQIANVNSRLLTFKNQQGRKSLKLRKSESLQRILGGILVPKTGKIYVQQRKSES